MISKLPESAYLLPFQPKNSQKLSNSFDKILEQHPNNVPQAQKEINESYFSLQNHQSGSVKYSINVPSLSHEWTDEDDHYLYEGYFAYGPKWSYISKLINKQTNLIKNKFYSRIRKLLTKLKYIAKKKIKPRKIIKYEALVRPLQALDFCHEPFKGYNANKNWLKTNIVNYSRRKISQIPEEHLKMLIQEVHYFNLQTRSYNLINPKIFREQSENMGIKKIKPYTSVSKFCTEMMSPEQIEERYQQEQEENKIKSQWFLMLSPENFYEALSLGTYQ